MLQGGVDAVIASIDANESISSESLSNGLQMIESVMQHPAALSKIVNSSLVNKIMDILNSHLDDPAIMLSCMRALEKVAKTSDGLCLIQEASGISSILQCMSAVCDSTDSTEEDVEIIKRATNVLGRMAKTGEVIRLIKEAGGVDTYLRVLDVFAGDERIARLGGKFLSRVTGDSVDELIAILNDTNASPAVIERTLALIAGLAMDGNSCSDIVSGGGCAALISQLDSAASEKALESTCRALARLARNAKNVQELVDGGVVGRLVAALGKKVATEESRAQAIDALARIANNPAYAGQLVAEGAVSAVTDCLAVESNYHPLSLASLKFYNTLQKNKDFDMGIVGAVPNVLSAILR